MPQPLEFKLSVSSPGPAVAFWDAFVDTVGRFVVPAAGQTSLQDPESDISSSVRHVAFTEECSGELLPHEKMLTPQFSEAGWPDIRPEIRQTYADLKTEDVASAFIATIPLRPKPLTVAAPVFRCHPRPDESRLLPIAGAVVEVSKETGTAAVTVERWLLTPAQEPYGLSADELGDLLNDLHRAFQDLRRTAPGTGARTGIVIPTTNLLPALEELLKRFQSEAAA
jgi:hypothetical protein